MVLEATDAAYHARARELFGQLKRAAISVEANIVEGYALNTPALCRRHLRIAIGSAAEAECLVRLAAERRYLEGETATRLQGLLSGAIAALVGLMRRPPVTEARLPPI
jgi:four helix bundle protein